MKSTDLIDKLQSQAVMIKFTKLNGEERVMKATLKLEITEENPSKTRTRDPNSEFSQSNRYPEKNFTVWDIESEGWRTIRWKSITEVNGDKIHNGIEYVS